MCAKRTVTAWCGALVCFAMLAFGAAVAQTDPSENQDRGSECIPQSLTTAERDRLSAPVAPGLTIFNRDIGCMQFYSGWKWVCAGNCAPEAPRASMHQAGATAITWNWGRAPGAQGYLAGRTRDAAEAADLGASLSFAEDSLEMGWEYALYVWAYNECGVSPPLVLQQRTAFSCGSALTVAMPESPDENAQLRNFTYNSAASGGECWLDRDLGAAVLAGSQNKSTPSSGGWFWEFDSNAAFRDAGVARDTAPAPQSPSHRASGKRWDPVNDPCRKWIGTAWRLPSPEEWTAMASEESSRRRLFQNEAAVTGDPTGDGLTYWSDSGAVRLTPGKVRLLGQDETPLRHRIRCVMD
jgi:hypothetical protein